MSGRCHVALVLFVLILVVPSTCQIEAADPTSDRLVIGHELTLSPGSTALLSRRLETGDFLRVVIEQRRVDIKVRLRAPNGTVLAVSDRPIDDDGPELVATVASKPGTYSIELESLETSGAPGRARVGELDHRQATRADRRYVDRVRALQHANDLRRRDELEAAVVAYAEIATWAAAVGEATLEAEARLMHAYVTGFFLDRIDEALDATRKALRVAPSASVWRKVALEYSGYLEITRGAPSAAVEPLRAAITLAERLDHQRSRANAHLHLGKAYRQQGEIQAALEHYLAARRLFRVAIDRAHVSHDIGVLYRSNLGRTDLAIDAFRRALKLYREIGDDAWLAYTLNQLGAAERTEGHADRARDAYLEALTVRRKLGQRCAEANTLARLALVDPGDAWRHAEQARLILAEETCRHRAAILRRLGDFERGVGKLQQATEDYRVAARLYRAAGDRAGEGIVLLGLAHVCRRLGTCDEEPLALVERVSSIFEETREALLDEAHRLDYGSHSHELFELLIDLQWTRGARNAAFASAERARARALRDRLARLRQADDPVGPAISLREVRNRLDDDTVFLAYRLGDERSYVWAATRDTTASFELAARRHIEHEASQVRGRLAAPTREAQAWRHDDFAALARTVIPTGLAPFLTKTRLLIVADGALELVPFAVLPGLDGEPLIADHEIVHVPSASAWAELSDRPPHPPAQGLLAVIADPVYSDGDQRLGGSSPHDDTGERLRGTSDLRRLPGAAEEARTLLELAPEGTDVVVLTGFDATKRAVLDGRLTGHRYLHFATHGVVDRRQPARSFLAFSRLDATGQTLDGDLFAHELYDAHLPAELVVLAGCNTGVGRVIPGEGLVSGLARGVLHAGARKVLASLWPISDRTTPELMRHVYSELFAGAEAATALRLAQLQLYADGRHPYEWAGFIVLGD
ncbi:MAG: CHAT domain-containing protein [Acidobacteriota bacterium]